MPRYKKVRVDGEKVTIPRDAPISTDQIGIIPTPPNRKRIMGFEQKRDLMRGWYGNEVKPVAYVQIKGCSDPVRHPGIGIEQPVVRHDA